MASTAIIPAHAVIAATNSQVSGDATPLPTGWIVGVSLDPYSPGSGFEAAVRARVDLLGPPDPNGTRPNLGSLWEGYVRSRGQPASIPNRYAFPGYAVQVVAASSTSLSVLGRAQARIEMADQEPVGAGFIFREPEGPASGDGDVAQVDLTNPGAGNPWPDNTVGAQTLERPEGAQSANNTTAAGGSARVYIYQAETSGGNVDLCTCAEAHQAASLNGFLSAARGAFTPSVTSSGVDGTDRGISLPDTVLRPGAKWRFTLRNLAAGDNLGQAFARVMRWAVIL